MQTLSTQTLRFFKHAQSTRLPLPKRLRALGLMAQELDQAPTFISALSAAGLQPTTSTSIKIAGITLARLLEEATRLVHTQLLPRVRHYHAQVIPIEQLSEAQRGWLWHYFQQQIYPLLTPFAVDSGRPFPFIQTRRLNFLVVLQSNTSPNTSLNTGKVCEAERYGLVQIPARVPRLIQAQPNLPLPLTTNPAKQMRCLIWREEIVRYFLPMLFSGMSVKAVYQFRLLRAPLNNSPAMLITSKQPSEVAQGPITRLDVEKAMPDPIQQWLINRLHIAHDQVLACATPLGLADLCELADYLTPLSPSNRA